MMQQRLALAAAIAIAAAAAVIGLGAGGAAAAPACGYRLGTVFVDRGAGSGGFDVPLLPAVPGQACTVTVPASAVISLPGGGRPSNVAGNPSSGTVTVMFSPFRAVPRVSWQWRPFCSDPTAVTFTATIGGASASLAVGANSCQSFGGASALQPPAVLPAQPAFSGVAGTPSGAGIWAVQAGGAVKAAGDATNLGAPAVVAAPVVGVTGTVSGHGYWLVASDGGIFSFGDAHFFGSTGAMHLNQPVVGMAATPDGGGYWLVASDGGIFTFGDATYEGSGGATPLSAPVSGMSRTPTGKGYWMLVQDGTVLNFGDAPALALP